MRTITFRLHPGQDIYLELERFVQQNQIPAACVLTCVGSLSRAVIRFADQPEGTVLEGDQPPVRFEIVSLTGVMSQDGSHYHISFSDANGRTLGGHLMEGCQVYTTAEIVLALLDEVRFSREFDPETGYPELVIAPRDEKKEDPY